MSLCTLTDVFAMVNKSLHRSPPPPEQGEWTKAIETAGEQGGSELKHKYVAHHATQLIRDGDARSALQLYRRHGAPPTR